jgi:hypothetical protein
MKFQQVSADSFAVLDEKNRVSPHRQTDGDALFE